MKVGTMVIDAWMTECRGVGGHEFEPVFAGVMEKVTEDAETVERIARAICQCPGPRCDMIDGPDKIGIPRQCAEQARRAVRALAGGS